MVGGRDGVRHRGRECHRRDEGDVLGQRRQLHAGGDAFRLGRRGGHGGGRRGDGRGQHGSGRGGDGDGDLGRGGADGDDRRVAVEDQLDGRAERHLHMVGGRDGVRHRGRECHRRDEGDVLGQRRQLHAGGDAFRLGRRGGHGGGRRGDGRGQHGSGRGGE